MHIAVEGCAHGELETIYKCVTELESENNIKIDLLICCGDFQAVRNENDLRCMAVPPKYYNMCSFYKYYSGELTAPVLTIFIGGNHEASNYLQELPFGGWVAPNIYYLGYASIVRYKGLRIGGISGIYKDRDYNKGHFESSPYGEDTKRSVYHIRNIEVFRLKQVSEQLDVFLSHDWPTEITKYGNEEQLLKFKPYFRDDISKGNLGSPPCKDLLFALKPKYWFAAHLHCKFAALVPHDGGTATKFLALDKCVPRKRFLQILEIPTEESTAKDNHNELEYDLEWITILHLSPHLFSTKCTSQYMPTKISNERWNFTPTEEEKNNVLKLFDNNLQIPKNFQTTAACYKPGSNAGKNIYQPDLQINAQTSEFCLRLNIPDPTEDLVQRIKAANKTDLDTLETDMADASVNVSNTSSQVKPTILKQSLILPEVINKVEEPTEIEANKKFEESRNCGSILELISNPDKSELVNQESKEEEPDNKPFVKIMKRRNASIYEQEEV